jgi:hypothetical protein
VLPPKPKKGTEKQVDLPLDVEEGERLGVTVHRQETGHLAPHQSAVGDVVVLQGLRMRLRRELAIRIQKGLGQVRPAEAIEVHR